MTDSTLNIAGKDYPVRQGSVGPEVVDIRKFYAQTGQFTYDPGFTSTAACESGLTYIDGDEGTLLHRGYPIGQLAEHSSFMEVAYLLLNGELPSQDELGQFTHTISRHTMVHEQLATFYRGFRRDAHPMAVMCGVVGALSAFYHDSTDISDPYQRMVASHRLIAKMPTIAARPTPRNTRVSVSMMLSIRLRSVSEPKLPNTSPGLGSLAGEITRSWYERYKAEREAIYREVQTEEAAEELDGPATK